MTTTHTVKHYKVKPDGTLRFVGNETVEVEEHHTPAALWHTIDNETMLKISDIAHNCRTNPDDRES